MTGVITSLFTKKTVFKKIFMDNKDDNRPDDCILKLLDISLKNDFETKGKGKAHQTQKPDILKVMLGVGEFIMAVSRSSSHY